ncbi:MAG: nitroreductase family protein [Clostridiales bacterium]|nr:nitroreductase family protein [Clostridiales bacterium]
MNVIEASKARRTIRKFKQKPVDKEALMQIIDCARLAPYGANLQPLKFAVITSEEERRKLFPLIKYAGYLSWNPAFEECPPAFIAILNDTSLKPTSKSECDSGAAGMSICLAATELGLGSVWLGAIDREGIKSALELDERYDITYLVGIGYAAQEGSVYDIEESIKYHFDENGNVHVPKRTLAEVLVQR